MPLHWKISHLDRMVVAVAAGTVTLADAMACLDAIAAAKVFPYRKLLDGIEGTIDFSDAEIRALATRIHTMPTEGRPGPIAVVASAHKARMSKILPILAKLDRPVKTFRNIHSARRWLELQPP
jgi:hypothetical protein